MTPEKTAEHIMQIVRVKLHEHWPQVDFKVSSQPYRHGEAQSVDITWDDTEDAPSVADVSIGIGVEGEKFSWLSLGGGMEYRVHQLSPVRYANRSKQSCIIMIRIFFPIEGRWQ